MKLLIVVVDRDASGSSKHHSLSGQGLKALALDADPLV